MTSSTTTDALILPKVGGHFTLSKVQLASLQEREVLVEIHSTGLCHTDLSSASGVIPGIGDSPALLGHEGAGTVVATGSGITTVSKGDKVLLSFYHCETCDQCTSGHPAYCYSFSKCFSGRRPDGSCGVKTEDGVEMYSSYFGQSSFARQTIVQESSVLKVPENTDLALYAPLGCGIQTGAGAVINTLKVREGSSLAVFGVGSVGMAAVMAGKLCKAKTIIAVDLNDSRLALAKELGATHTVKGDDPDLIKTIQGICPPTGVNFAVDCSGVPAVVEKMIEAIGTRGKAATVGAPSPGKKAGVDIFTHLVLGKEYVGCCEGDSVPREFIPYLIKEHKAGNFPVDKLVKFYNMKDHEQAIKDAEEGRTLKAVLTW